MTRTWTHRGARVPANSPLTTAAVASRDWVAAIGSAYALARQRRHRHLYAVLLTMPLVSGVALHLLGLPTAAAVAATFALELLTVTYVTRGQRALQRVMRATRAHRISEVVQVLSVQEPQDGHCLTEVSSLESDMEFLDDDCRVLHRQSIQLGRQASYPLPSYLYEQLTEAVRCAASGTMTRLQYADGTLGAWQLQFDGFTVETTHPR